MPESEFDKMIDEIIEEKNMAIDEAVAEACRPLLAENKALKNQWIMPTFSAGVICIGIGIIIGISITWGSK